MIKFIRNDSTSKTLDMLVNQITDGMEYLSILEKLQNVVVDKDMESVIIQSTNELICTELQTLRYDSRLLSDNPYIRDIKLVDDIGESFKVDSVIVPKGVLHNMGFFVNRFLLDSYIPIGYYNKDVEYNVLRDNNNEVWMSVTYSEISTIQEHIDKAKGNVATVGLGIGYYVYMCLLKEEVEHITVYEKDINIINYFKKHIVPQFKGIDKDRLTIIHDDLFNSYIDFGLYDYVFIDTWKDSDDGLNNYYIPLLEQTEIGDNVGFWIEDTLLYHVRVILAIYMIYSSNGSSISNFMDSATRYNRDVAIKVNRYMKTINSEIVDSEVLLHMLNSKDYLRKILAYKKK